MSKIDSLIDSMSLAEKLGQLTMNAAGYAETGPVIAGDSTESIRAGTVGNLLNMIGAGRVREMQRLAVEESRLGIPLLIGLDVLHGYRTLFPVPLAEAALFDPQTWEQTARAAAVEAAADGLSLTFAPMVDVSRDPRWGRSVEGPGEDPWVGARFAAAKVRGFQGPDLAAADALAAVAKHFCAYGAVTAGRDYASVDISERTVHEVHLPPFAAALAAGVAAIMPAFTDLAGIPMSANVPLLRGWLRGRMGFDGVIISDFNAIAELMRHGIAADLAEAGALALKAGVDIDMMGGAYRHGLPVALERGLVSIADIDAAVRRVLELKQRLGLFDRPYRRGEIATSSASRTEHRQLARSVAARAIVMLTNERDVLPLPGSVRRLAVLGPLADTHDQMRGPWWGAAAEEDPVSVADGFRNVMPETEVLCAPGVTIYGDDTTGIESALQHCSVADGVILCIGEAVVMSGEAASRARLGLPGQQRAFAEAVLQRAKARGIPVVAVLFAGRPLVVPWLIEQADAVLAAWFLGSEAGNAIADVVTGRVSPSGRTPVTWARAIGQAPIFFGQRAGGRPADPQDRYTSKFLDVADTPLFHFGHGLSYGRFGLSNLRVTPERATENDSIEVRVDVTNTGARTAQETVFVFSHDKVASVSRPLLELKGVGKIVLPAGASGTVVVRLPAAELRFPGMDLEPVFEAGEIEILAGPCADRSRLLCCSIHLTPTSGCSSA
ncbi:MAG: glycoside hydrolase family 3 N-terminal domain-containing protein [Steroidobacterales bacterium]